MLEILRNNSAIPGAFPGLKIMSEYFTNSDGSNATVYTLETGCTEIIFVIGYAGTTVIAPTIGNSTTYPGTKTVAFSVPLSGVLKYLVIGSNELAQAFTAGDDLTRVGFDT